MNRAYPKAGRYPIGYSHNKQKVLSPPVKTFFVGDAYAEQPSPPKAAAPTLARASPHGRYLNIRNIIICAKSTAASRESWRGAFQFYECRVRYELIPIALNRSGRFELLPASLSRSSLASDKSMLSPAC